MKKRMHPMRIVHSMFEVLRGFLFVIILLFINRGSDSWMYKYGFWAFILFLIGTLIYLIASWYITKYEFKDETAHTYKGVFRKKHTSVPLYRIQNVQRKTPIYFKWFNVTSLTLETGIMEDGANVQFEAITLEEADRIEELVNDARKKQRAMEAEEQGFDVDEGIETEVGEEKPKSERIIHFNPTKREILKASFLSFSFLALIPITFTFLLNLDELFDIEEHMSGLFETVTSSFFTIVLTIIGTLVISTIFGIIYAYLRYGRYEISSDEDRIYIRSGILNEKSFSIRKDRVQAIQIKQPILKKALGLAEVKLISASSGIGEENEISSLYPFLPVERAFSILGEILPDFKILYNMNKLPKEALMVRMLRIPWTVLIALVVVIIVDLKYWWVVLGLIVIIYSRRYFMYRNARYKIEGSFIQFKVGGLSTTVFLTTRRLVTEIEIEQSILQKKWDLVSMVTYNRTAIFHVEVLEDIPSSVGEEFRQWYVDRLDDIELDE